MTQQLKGNIRAVSSEPIQADHAFNVIRVKELARFMEYWTSPTDYKRGYIDGFRSALNVTRIELGEA